jgi:hypothetical protein
MNRYLAIGLGTLLLVAADACLAQDVTEPQTTVEAGPVLRVINLRPPADAATVLGTLSSFVPENVQIAAHGSSQLLVRAPSDEEVEAIRQMIELLGLETEDDAAGRLRKVTVIPLHYLRDPAGVLAALRGLRLVPRSASIAAWGDSALAVSGATEEDLQAIRGIIAQLDLPRSQVQLDLWGVQVSGPNAVRVGEVAEEVRTKVSQTRERIQADLATITRWAATLVADPEFREALTDAGELGFTQALKPGRSLNLFDALLFWAASQDPAQAATELAAAWAPFEVPRRFLAALGVTAGKNGAFQATSARDAATRMRYAVLSYGKAYSALAKAPDAVPGLAFQSAASDLESVVQAACRALQDDMQEMRIRPLLSELRAMARNSGGGTVSLVGNTSVVTLDGCSAYVAGQATSFYDITQTPPLGQTLEYAETLEKRLAPYLQSESGGVQAVGEVTGGAATGLSPGNKLLVLLAATQDQMRVWSELDDGVTVRVTPHVGPNADTAELALYVNVTRKAPQVHGPEGTGPDPFDRIGSHTVGKAEDDQVRMRVNSLDLFPISTFSLQTSHRRPDRVVPILGELPIVGKLFRSKRSPAVVHHESILLVNSTIVPSAADLSRLYPAATGLGFSVKAWSPLEEQSKAEKLLESYLDRAPGG